jgi:hypothetical protein
MPHYRISLLERSGHIFSEWGAVFADDEAAVAAASGDVSICRLTAEVWLGARCVARISPGATASRAAYPSGVRPSAEPQAALGSCCQAAA